MRKTVPAFIAIAVLAACSSSDATGPSTASVAGNWTYSASNLSGSGLSCGIGGVTLIINQSGNTFSGSTIGGTLTCVAGGESATGALGNDIIVNGSVNGNQVRFDIGTSDLTHSGSINGSSMSGSMNARVDFGGSIGVINMSGNWAAAR